MGNYKNELWSLLLYLLMLIVTWGCFDDEAPTITIILSCIYIVYLTKYGFEE